MVILKFLMRVGNIPLIDKYIVKFGVEKLDSTDLKAFIIWYLNQQYDRHSKYPLMILDLFYEASRKIDIAELDELAVDSVFLNSIPENIIFSLLRYGFGEKFYSNLNKMLLLNTFLTSKISDNDKLIELINVISNGGVLDYDYAIRKLVSVGEIDTLLDYDKKIEKTVYRNDLANRMALSGKYNLEEIKRYLEKANIPVGTIVNIFTSLYVMKEDIQENIVDTFMTLINISQELIDNGREIDRKTGKYQPGYDGYLNSMTLIRMPMDMKNMMAKKLLEERNYQFIEEWLVQDINCDLNFNLIDAFIEADEDNFLEIFEIVNEQYLEYVFTKILDKGRYFVSELVETICSDYDIFSVTYDINRIDQLLDFIYYRYYDFKISKKSGINLIKLGSLYVPKFMGEYDFTESERDDIWKTYKWCDNDFLRVYETYLLSGDKTYLLSEKDTEAKFAELEARRNRSRERRNNYVLAPILST